MRAPGRERKVNASPQLGGEGGRWVSPRNREAGVAEARAGDEVGGIAGTRALEPWESVWDLFPSDFKKV